MMKGATEKAVQLEPMAGGHAGSTHNPRGRKTGAERLLADFDKLLAKHQSAVRDEKSSEAPADAAAPMTTSLPRPEAAFFTVAQEGNGLSPQATPVSPLPAPQATEDGTLVITPDLVQPLVLQKPVEPKTEAKADRPVMKVDHMLPHPPNDQAEDRPVMQFLQKPAADGGEPDRTGLITQVMQKPAIVADDSQGLESAVESNPVNLPVILVRAVAPETHLPPAPLALVGAPDTLTMAMGPAMTSEAAPPPPVTSPPVMPKFHVGPLKLLKVELGSTELGPINATMALRDSALDLRIGALRDDAVASLREHAGKLSDALQSLGYSVDGITVQKLHQHDIGQQAANGQPMQQGAAGQDPGAQSQRDLAGSRAGAEGSSRQSRQAFNGNRNAEHESNDQSRGPAGNTRSSRDVFV